MNVTVSSLFSPKIYKKNILDANKLARNKVKFKLY